MLLPCYKIKYEAQDDQRGDGHNYFLEGEIGVIVISAFQILIAKSAKQEEKTTEDYAQKQAVDTPESLKMVSKKLLANDIFLIHRDKSDGVVENSGKEVPAPKVYFLSIEIIYCPKGDGNKQSPDPQAGNCIIYAVFPGNPHPHTDCDGTDWANGMSESRE